MKREFDHLAAFMHMAVDYAKQIGFNGQFYFEPKPKEPTKHQYDYDVANCINFLRTYGLTDHVKMNIETNHATLAGHTMQHELEYAGSQGFLGSIDANTGDLLLGWDTDQFPTDIYLTTTCMLSLLKYGGLAPGGINFDAKVRRESFEPVDLFHAHIGGMDAFARGLKIAAAIRADGILDKMLKERYSSWDIGIGARIECGQGKFRLARKVHARKGRRHAQQERPPGVDREYYQHLFVISCFDTCFAQDSSILACAGQARHACPVSLQLARARVLHSSRMRTSRRQTTCAIVCDSLRESLEVRVASCRSARALQRCSRRALREDAHAPLQAFDFQITLRGTSDMQRGFLIDMDGVIYRGGAADSRRRRIHRATASLRNALYVSDQQQPAHPPRRRHAAGTHGHRRRRAARLHLRHGHRALSGPATSRAARPT